MNTLAVMGIARTVFNTFVGTGVLGVAGWSIATRNAKFIPILTTDAIFEDPAYRRNNPYKNPATQDYCVRRVPLKNLKPQLLEKEGKLAEAFCAGVWGGLGKITHFPRPPEPIGYRKRMVTENWDRIHISKVIPGKEIPKRSSDRLATLGPP